MEAKPPSGGPASSLRCCTRGRVLWTLLVLAVLALAMGAWVAYTVVYMFQHTQGVPVGLQIGFDEKDILIAVNGTCTQGSTLHAFEVTGISCGVNVPEEEGPGGSDAAATLRRVMTFDAVLTPGQLLFLHGISSSVTQLRGTGVDFDWLYSYLAGTSYKLQLECDVAVTLLLFGSMPAHTIYHFEETLEPGTNSPSSEQQLPLEVDWSGVASSVGGGDSSSNSADASTDAGQSQYTSSENDVWTSGVSMPYTLMIPQSYWFNHAMNKLQELKVEVPPVAYAIISNGRTMNVTMDTVLVDLKQDSVIDTNNCPDEQFRDGVCRYIFKLHVLAEVQLAHRVMDGEDTLSAMGYVSSSFMRRLTSTPESSPLLDQFYSLANPDAEGGDPLTVDLQALDSQSFTSNLLGPQHQAIVQGDADGCVHDFIVEASLDYDGRPLGAVSVSVALPSAADAPTFTTSAVLLVYEYVQLEGGEDYEMDLLASCNASAMVNTESGSGLVSVAVAYEQLDVFSMKLQWDDFVLQHDSAIDASAFMEMDITRNVYSTCVEHNVQQVRVVQQLDRTSMLTTVLGAGDSLHIGSDVTVDTMSKRQSTTCPSMLDEQWMNVLTLTTDTSVETHEINGQGTFTLGGSGADEQGMYTFDYQGMYDTEAIGPQHWGDITLACDVRASETDSSEVLLSGIMDASYDYSRSDETIQLDIDASETLYGDLLPELGRYASCELDASAILQESSVTVEGQLKDADDVELLSGSMDASYDYTFTQDLTYLELNVTSATLSCADGVGEARELLSATMQQYVKLQSRRLDTKGNLHLVWDGQLLVDESNFLAGLLDYGNATGHGRAALLHMGAGHAQHTDAALLFLSQVVVVQDDNNDGGEDDDGQEALDNWLVLEVCDVELLQVELLLDDQCRTEDGSGSTPPHSPPPPPPASGSGVSLSMTPVASDGSVQVSYATSAPITGVQFDVEAAGGVPVMLAGATMGDAPDFYCAVGLNQFVGFSTAGGELTGAGELATLFVQDVASFEGASLCLANTAVVPLDAEELPLLSSPTCPPSPPPPSTPASPALPPPPTDESSGNGSGMLGCRPLRVACVVGRAGGVKCLLVIVAWPVIGIAVGVVSCVVLAGLVGLLMFRRRSRKGRHAHRYATIPPDFHADGADNDPGLAPYEDDGMGHGDAAQPIYRAYDGAHAGAESPAFADDEVDALHLGKRRLRQLRAAQSKQEVQRASAEDDERWLSSALDSEL